MHIFESVFAFDETNDIKSKIIVKRPKRSKKQLLFSQKSLNWIMGFFTVSRENATWLQALSHLSLRVIYKRM
ncbi:hypothetical protein ALQ37_200184 [Pseudomonas syringae pv. aptata]|uniref:Uncharacterized protein n=1 Tax=Pseudomonas syringae pv. aptata TaxID=83167 RepID=A0A3M3X677_PSEAP|nr:hypothetical protein ALQ37_200184 [Pseudomonas syringae pv. aptata]